MNKIKLFVLLCVIASLCASCARIKSALGSKPPAEPLPALARVRDTKNALADPYVTDESAIVVSVISSTQSPYVGGEPYPREILGEKIHKLLEKAPAERALVYLNADVNAPYGEIAFTLDKLRKQGVENVGLVVAPVKGGSAVQAVLKVKITPALTGDVGSPRYPFLVMQKDGKVNFGGWGGKNTFTIEPESIGQDEVDSRLPALIKEKAPTEIHIRPTHINNYGGVVRLVDVAAGAGSTVYLEVDDLTR